MEEAKQSKPSFCEWFNPDDIDHLHAYHILQKTGMWPIDFVPEKVWVEPGWQAILAFKIANKWIDYKLCLKNGKADLHVIMKEIQETETTSRNEPHRNKRTI